MLRKAKIKKLDSAIRDVIKEYGLEEKLKNTSVINLWSEIVGERIAQVTKATRIKDGKLSVNVENSVWRNELIFLKKEIIQKINNRFKEEIVKDIIFR
ncbi:MAG: hypothetical protein IGBAC_0136 [Ignavibacteriae bacterium]|nr:MAG: hypothetical protein IGBAC_0136 [Ignavibacteriota bacterium]